MADEQQVPVIDLANAPGAGESWDRPPVVLAVWLVAELLLVTNPLQISSALRASVLRAFGAQIGRGVILRPRLRVKFPWKLRIGDRSWIGEGVWIHNQNRVHIGSDVVLSQDTFITTGSHRHRTDMGLITKQILIEDGAWITSRCIVLGGTHVGRSALARPLTVVKGDIPANAVVSGPDCEILGPRLPGVPIGTPGDVARTS